MAAAELPKPCATMTPHITPSAQPVVTTIHPESAAYDLRSVTPAFTPFPNSTSTRVPMNSPNHAECIPYPPPPLLPLEINQIQVFFLYWRYAYPNVCSSN